MGDLKKNFLEHWIWQGPLVLSKLMNTRQLSSAKSALSLNSPKLTWLGLMAWLSQYNSLNFCYFSLKNQPILISIRYQHSTDTYIQIFITYFVVWNVREGCMKCYYSNRIIVSNSSRKENPTKKHLNPNLPAFDFRFGKTKIRCFGQSNSHGTIFFRGSKIETFFRGRKSGKVKLDELAVFARGL